MQKNNPAVFECTSSSTIHHWLRLADQTAVCAYCKMKLTKEHADEVWAALTGDGK